MANTASALKRIRSNNRKRVRNKINRSRTRTAVRAARAATPEEAHASHTGRGGHAAPVPTLEEARAATVAAISSLDRAAKKGVIHPNNAARRKSRLMKRLNASTAK